MTAAVFIATYACVAIGKVPGTRIGRTGIALAGAALMLLVGAIGPADALRSIDRRTIALLLAMMLIVAPLRLAGVFSSFVRVLSARVRHPAGLMIALVVAAGLLSAIFVNDTICIVFTPVVLELAALRRHRPLPYLLALATSSNVGSVATIVGNPQNMLIGSVSGIGLWRFTAALLPIALVGFAIDALIVWLAFRGELHRGPGDDRDAAAYGPAGLGNVTLAGIVRSIDWSLLLLFAGLFIVVGAAARAGIDRRLFELLRPLGMETVAGLSATAAALSNVVSNVPAVMLFIPLVPRLPDPQRAWLALAMSSTLAGNLTIVGSIANLIVVEGARRSGVHVSLGDYMKVGVPVTLATLAFGVWWLG